MEQATDRLVDFTQPEVSVSQALKELIAEKTTKDGLPIIAIETPRRKLRRMGVSHVVKIQAGVKDVTRFDFVPIRITGSTMRIADHLSSIDDFKSWRGREIVNICIRFRDTIDKLVHILRKRIATAVNRLRRKIEKKLCIKNRHSRGETDKFRRVHPFRLAPC